MKKKVYECAVLINAALEDDQIEAIIDRIKETISGNGGQIREIENWGRKRLAYTVRKSKIGYYVIFRLNAPSDLISKLERFFQLDENILRYLSVNLSKDALDQIERDKVQTIAAEVEVEEVDTAPAEEENDNSENSELENNQ